MTRLMPHTLKALESELAYHEVPGDVPPLLEEAAGYYQLYATLDTLNREMMVRRAKHDDGGARDRLRQMAALCIRLMNVEPVEPRTRYSNTAAKMLPVDEIRTATNFDTLYPKGMSFKLIDGQYIPETDPPAPKRSNTAEAIDRAWEEIPYAHKDWVELDTAFDRIARQLGTIEELSILTVPHAGDLFWIKDVGEYCMLVAVIPPAHWPDGSRGTYMLRDSRVNRQTGEQFDTAAGRMGGYNDDGEVVSYVSVPYDQTMWQEHDRKGIARLREDQEWETDLLSLPDPQRSDLFYVNAKKAYCIILRAPVVDGPPGEYMLRHALNRTALDDRAPYRVGDSHGDPTAPKGTPGFTVRHKPGVPNGFDVVTDQVVVEHGNACSPIVHPDDD